MHTRLLHEDNGQRTFAVILETGEEVLPVCSDLCAAITCSRHKSSDVVLMYFDWDKKDYL
jgi:uncharacterized protein